jgi:predicted kinase
MKKPKLILIRGLPGSGKTTLAESIASVSEAEHFEADMYFMKDGVYCFDKNQIGVAHKWCYEKTWNQLCKKETVIVSNTFTTVKELKMYFELALEFEILPQVILCQSNYGSIHNVPNETLLSMKNRFHYDISELERKYKCELEFLMKDMISYE